MAQILTCIEGVGDNGICPAGMIPELVEGYISTADPTAFDPSIAAQYFAFSFGTVLVCYAFSKSLGIIIGLVKRG